MRKAVCYTNNKTGIVLIVSDLGEEGSRKRRSRRNVVEQIQEGRYSRLIR